MVKLADNITFNFFVDENAADVDGMIYCKSHKFKYKAIETHNKCIKKYKNCPYCEKEVNYRIELKKHYDAIDWNVYALNNNLDLIEVSVKPEKPEWWLEASKNGFYPKKFKDIYVFKDDRSVDTLIKDFDSNLDDDSGIDYPF